jgi:predicted nucleotidyltransferase
MPVGRYPFESALRELFGGQLRYRVLRTLFEQPDREFHLRGLASAARVDAGNTHRVLKRLIDAQLCEVVAAAPYTKYRARKDNPLYSDLVRLFSRGSELMSDIRRVAADIPGSVAIYGSVARGEERAGSDIDVLSIGPLSTILAQAAFKPVGRKHGRKINVTAATEDEVLDKLEAGSRFWRDVLTGPLTMVKGDIPNEVARRLSRAGKQGISSKSTRSARHRELPTG